MLSTVTLNCQITKIVMNSGSQLSELQSVFQMSQVCRLCRIVLFRNCERTLPHTIQNAAPVARKNPATGSKKMWFIYAPWRETSGYALNFFCEKKRFHETNFSSISSSHQALISFDILMHQAEPSLTTSGNNF